MRSWLLAALLLALPFAAAPAPATAAPSPTGGVFADATGAHPADFALSGSCNGPGTLTVTIHRPSGDDVRTVAVESVSVPGVCGGGMRCLDCPPVPYGFAWTLTGEDVLLAGGGGAYYFSYRDWPLAWSLQGPFQEGVLEIYGVLG
jgi:hypothetical protein